MPKMIRTSFTLPPDVHDDLSYVARRLGVTRSALVADLLREALSMVVPSLRELPEDPDERDVLRYRGESERLIDQRLESARRLRDDLFSGQGGSDS